MNQILQVENRYNSGNKKSGNIKGVVVFFAIAIIIFGIIIVGYAVMSNQKNNKNNTVVEPQYKLNINIQKNEENQAIINIASDIAISHIEYNWNNGISQTLQETGKTNVMEIIDIPVGENTLYLSVFDMEGRETKEEKSYIIDASKPDINLTVVGTDIKFIVKSEVDLEYVTYKWNNEKEIKQDMYTYEDKTQFEKQLSIPSGSNTLVITAVDVNGEKEERSQEFKGVVVPKTPTIEVIGEYVHFNVEANENIKLVQFTFNSVTYKMTKTTFGETKTVHYKMKLKEGKNYLTVEATTESDGKNSTSWEYEYKAQ